MNGQKNTKQKLLSLVLVVMMVLSTMVIMPLTASAVSEAVKPSGTGTWEDPYILTKAGHFNWFRSSDAGLLSVTGTDIYLEMANDITLAENDAIISGGNWAAPYNNAWHFDGKGYTLSGLTISLFSGAGPGTTIENLTIAASTVVADSGSDGVLIGCQSGTATIENVVIADDVTLASSDGHDAAFVGTCTGAVNFINCINNADVVSKGNAGGFVGGTSSDCSFTNCINNGNITATTNTTRERDNAGGFVGLHEGGEFTFKNCVNNGTITAKFNAGGFLGSDKMPGYTTSFEDCYDNGTVNRQLASNDTLTPHNTKSLAEVYAGIMEGAQPVTAENVSEPWTGVASETAPGLMDTSEGATNSATNPYLIYTAEQLAYFSTVTTDYYIQLQNHIDLAGKDWTWLNPSTNVMLDGQGYTIRNFTISNENTCRGFFNAFGKATVTIKNVHFVGAKVDPKDNQSGTFGLLIPHVAGAATVTIDHVTFDNTSYLSSLRTTSGAYAAFIGDSWSSPNITISNCFTAATIAAPCARDDSTNAIKEYIGGFIGKDGAASVKLENCIQAGSIQATYVLTQKGSIFGTVGSSRTLNNVYDTTFSNGEITSITNSYSKAQVTNEMNVDAIAAINTMGLSNATVNSTVTVKLQEGGTAARRATRLKVTDDFGFMALADLTTDLDRYNPYVTYGMLVMAGTAEATDADDLKADGTFVAGERYQDIKNELDNEAFCVAYTDITVATMNQAYAYATAIMVNGEIVAVGTVYDINCYDWASQLSDDGVLDDGTAVTKVETEWALYGAMVTYCDKYDAYLTYLESLNA